MKSEKERNVCGFCEMEKKKREKKKREKKKRMFLSFLSSSSVIILSLRYCYLFILVPFF